MMPKINKNIIFGISIAIILFFVVIIGWTFLPKEEKPFVPEEIIEEEKDIRYFYKNDYHPILERKSTQRNNRYLRRNHRKHDTSASLNIKTGDT